MQVQQLKLFLAEGKCLFVLFDDSGDLVAQGASAWAAMLLTYPKTSSISHTKSQSLNVSCILAQLSSLNPLKPGVKLRMKK